MINICSQCKNKSKSTCDNCNGNPKLVDNFRQKIADPLKPRIYAKRKTKRGMKMGYNYD